MTLDPIERSWSIGTTAALVSQPTCIWSAMPSSTRYKLLAAGTEPHVLTLLHYDADLGLIGLPPPIRRLTLGKEPVQVVRCSS